MGIRSNGMTHISLYMYLNYVQESSCRTSRRHVHWLIWGLANVQNFNKGSSQKTVRLRPRRKCEFVYTEDLKPLAGVVYYSRISCGLVVSMIL
jgi:hypothetical protein